MARTRGFASCLKCRGRLNRFGFDRNGCPRARCNKCGTFTTTSNPAQRHIRSPRKHERAKEYLLQGESIRSTAQILGISKGTVERALDEIGDIEIKCGCGDDARHQGWCSVRLARSPKRQAFLMRWGITPDFPVVVPRRSNVPSFCVGSPHGQTAMAIERATLRSGILGDHGISLEGYFKASNEIWKAAKRLGCRVCGTYRKYGGQRCRRCTTIQKRIWDLEGDVGFSISRPIREQERAFKLFAESLANNSSLSRYQKLQELLRWKPEKSQN